MYKPATDANAEPGGGDLPRPDRKAEIVQVAAGFNHSVSLSKSGKAYSWGYSGKGLLGRQEKNDRLPLPVGRSVT